ncbi:hypothetical protein VY476_002134 [Salmonella enterica]|nr:hypothetical protein [Salmonella enterica]
MQDCDWLHLSVLNEQEVTKWVETRLSQCLLLYRVVDEYVFFACFGFWSETPTP